MAGGAALASGARNRWLLASFAVTALLLLLLLWNVVHTQQTLAQLEETQLSLERAAGELPFHIQGMQTSVRLAAESGDLNWRKQHQEHRQEARSTLARIEQATSTPAVARATDRLETRLEEAEAFHQRVFERLVRGEKEAARSILGKWPYIRNLNAMREASEGISNLLQEGVRGRLSEQRQLAGGTALAALLLSLVMLLSWLLFLRNWNLNIRERRDLEAEQRLLATAFHTTHALMITDPAGTIERVNAAFTTITGYPPEEVIGANPRILASGKQDADFYAALWRQLNEQDHWEGEIWNRRRNGEIYPEWESITAVRDEEGKVANYVAVFHEITEQKRLEAELERQATVDCLTGIYNRTKLYELLEAAREENKRYSTPFSVIMCDIDHFKAVNDTYGHGTGDSVLRELTERVQGVLRETDHLGRWGGEEFLILAGHADREGAEHLAERVRWIVADKPFPAVGVVTASLGVAEFRAGETLERLEERADEALYAAKETGRNRVRMEPGHEIDS
ncbi:MAG: GGDEF domain-containing protein [Thioalkalivibrio sp.]